MSNRRSPTLKAAVITVVIAAAAVALATFFVVRSRTAGASSEPAASASANPLDALLASPGGSSEPVGDATETRARVLASPTLTGAIALARPLMTNTVGKLDLGSALLALWASRSLTWEGLEAIPETSPALFRKDPDAERGKRLCITGTIQQIRAEKSLSARIADDRAAPLIERPSQNALVPTDTPLPVASDSAGIGLPEANFGVPVVDLSIPGDGKVFVAVIVAKPETPPDGTHPRPSYGQQKDLLTAEVIAVKSTGSLVDNSDVRACGILTGVTLPSPDSGSTLPSDVTEHRIVGMFDLPENRGGSGEIARHGG